jgi:alkylated DNA repair dioxygenase AlkB
VAKHRKVQAELFGAQLSLPEGFAYEPEFLSAAEEAELLSRFASLAFREAKYKQFTAKRRIVAYGGSYDFSSNELLPAGPVPGFLHPLRARIASLAEVTPEELSHALIAEYRVGTRLGWHRDVPDFDTVTGVSLAGGARMRLRPYPPKKGRRNPTLSIELAPRSAYVMRGAARWCWQHMISPTKELRYSITFRSLATAR